MTKLSFRSMKAGLNDESLVKARKNDADCTKLSARECSASDSRNDRSRRIYSPANTSINHLDRTREKFLGKTKEPSVWSWTSKNRSDLPPRLWLFFFSLELYLKKNERKAWISSIAVAIILRKHNLHLCIFQIFQICSDISFVT